MPTSSQCNIRGQETTPGVKNTPVSAKSNKSEKVDPQKPKSLIQRHNHHQSDPSLNAKLHSEGRTESPLPKTPVRGNVLHRSRSIPSLHDKNIQARSEEKGKDGTQKFSNVLPKYTSCDRTPVSQYATPRRSGAQRTKQPSSNHRQYSESQQRHSLKAFSCEINLKLSATPDCYNKVHMETPLRKEELGNVSVLTEAETSNLTVGVRVRPINSRENSDTNIMNVISVVGNEVTVKCDTGTAHTFVYDHCFLSDQPHHPQYAHQNTIFSTMVEPLLEKMFEGYNACLFAYGQTGSGKSYSMMGVDSDMESVLGKEAGIIPRFCHKLFNKITSETGSSTTSTTVEISYFEIYNEKIHDLLGGSSDPGRKPLKVREHPVFGPYVEDLSVHGVTSYEDLKGWLKVGNSQRATAATGMNEKSSRSHSIFSVILTQTEEEEVLEDHHVHSKRSKINLVDLAGSERISHACVSGDRLR
ncbi:Kinesin-like protein Klp10A, partial [Gryllus bimaculatus]